MKSYRVKGFTKTGLNINNSIEGESIERSLERISENKEPIDNSRGLVYTERKDGVLPAYDIRTDRFELAVEATDKIAKSYLAKREERLKEKGKVVDLNKKDVGNESTQGTDN